MWVPLEQASGQGHDVNAGLEQLGVNPQSGREKSLFLFVLIGLTMAR